MGLIAERLAAVRAEVDAAARACGRDPSTVNLLAVSKTFPGAIVREAYDAGHRAFGENYAQELRDKATELSGLGISWHYVGRLQKNKAKYVAAAADVVHALEDVEQAEALSARRTTPLRVMLEVHLGGEASKGGLAPDQVLDRCEAMARVPNILPCGLMTLPPPAEDPEAMAPFFAELADLAARGRARGLALTELSMGMSHDFPVAIRHGATWVRVGSAIFGARTPL